MPVQTRYIEETGLFETVLSGVVSDDEYIDNYRSLMESGVVLRRWLEILIVESEAQLKLSSRGFATVVELARSYSSGEGITRAAVVSLGPRVDDFENHYRKVMHLLAAERHTTKTFNSISEAMIWLLGHD